MKKCPRALYHCNHEERMSLKVDQEKCKELHQDGSTSRRDEEGQAQDAPSLEDLMLEACHPHDHGVIKTSSKKRFPHGLWGFNLQGFIEQEQTRKVFPLEKNKTVYIKFKWNAQGKGMIL